MKRTLAWIQLPVAVAALAACSTALQHPAPPSVVVPEALRPAPGETLLRTLAADGVQIYECRAKAADPTATEWAFVAPEARLVDDQGKLVGRHYAGPTWEAGDGSKVVGAVRVKLDAPEAGAIPWLLLATHTTGRPGLFAKVTSIQRVATHGGAAPAGGCTRGQTARVPYTAEYVQFAPTL